MQAVLANKVSATVLATDEGDAYARYLLNCSDYLKRQMMIYEHWPQRRYDALGYREEKVFTDMNS